MSGRIFVFEGLPGCGKSTVAREVADRMQNCVIMPEVSESAASRGFEVADRTSIGTESWFLTQYYTRDTEAMRLRDEGKTVIEDRNYVSSLAFGFANFVASNNPSFFMHFPSYVVNKSMGTLVRPDAYIFFEIPVSESVKRQGSREELTEELRTRNIKVLEDCEKFYRAFFAILEPDIPLYEVDATQPMESVLEDVLGILDMLTKER